MQQVLAMLYLWLKAGHVIFVIFWMAGLFMLPRFFVYHQEAPEGSPENAIWVDREAKLMKIIMWPALVVVWVLGLLLAVDIGAFSQGWFHLKLAFVLVLTAYHFWLATYAQQLAQGVRKLSGKKLRMLNEIPGIAAAVIVIMVIVKPF
ncbi:CopD family protein [Novosphingobium taihuense]|uniref:Protoporphyrinogen IX oxidase n=1 Tax=Novosphingobium taihuense TaxID=260085 RepID=A0A7W7EUN4_9SPHN|nr:CopD family protein [Novosphingobium taihuense]MBB4614598.1 putative membrane protein [Novosphingobium taihuense]TWH86160.1 putative membrane protein [Novosphingobium taihuense]